MNNRSRQKRGTDNYWEVRRYNGDSALYAHCKCGFQYNCSSSERVEYEDGTWSLNQIATLFYSYCPACGASKKWCNEEPIRIHKFIWE